MIDPAIAAGLTRIEARERDVSAAYVAGAFPESSDVAAPSKMLASADPLSVVAPEGTYFATPGGNGSLHFSRDGGFAARDGELCASDGLPVLGFALGNRTSLVPLRVDPYDAALGRVSNLRIDPDGSFAYTRTAIDPRSGERRAERIAVGRVALARFPAGTQLERVDAQHVRAPQGSAPHLGVPADGRFARLATHARDLGRVDIIAGIEKMNEAYRSFDALRAANHVRGAFDKTTMDLLK